MSLYELGSADYDFIEFTYNGKNSRTDLNIVRTSDGSRYNENLGANFTPKTQTQNGVAGTLFFGSTDTTKQFNVSFAFDSLTEAQFVQLNTVFGDRGIHDLVFSEEPYKVWSAAVASPVQLKYICFMENGARIYKGEGTVQFTCYYPYAHNPSGKYCKNDYNINTYPNKVQWADASGLPTSYSTSASIQCNYGTMPAPLTIAYKSGETEPDGVTTVTILYGASFASLSNRVTITLNSSGYGVYLNTKTGVVGRYSDTESSATMTPCAFTGNSLIKIPAGYYYGINYQPSDEPLATTITSSNTPIFLYN